MIKYRVIKTQEMLYGLEAVEENTVLERSDGIFRDKRSAVRFAQLCSELELSPLHLSDIVQDILNDHSRSKRSHRKAEKSTKE